MVLAALACSSTPGMPGRLVDRRELVVTEGGVDRADEHDLPVDLVLGHGAGDHVRRGDDAVRVRHAVGEVEQHRLRGQRSGRSGRRSARLRDARSTGSGRRGTAITAASESDGTNCPSLRLDRPSARSGSRRRRDRRSPGRDPRRSWPSAIPSANGESVFATRTPSGPALMPVASVAEDHVSGVCRLPARAERRQRPAGPSRCGRSRRMRSPGPRQP